MFKKKEKPKRDHSGKNLSQYGLFDIPTNFDTGVDNIDDDDNDSDLEAELAALADGGGSAPKRPQRRNKNLVPQKEFDRMVSDSMKDVNSDDDVSVDENDPELLGELSELVEPEEKQQSTPSSDPSPQGEGGSDVASILIERIRKYEKAEIVAKEAEESSKARRYGRAIKTLKTLLSQAQKGIDVNLNDDSVPPDIHVGDNKPNRPAPPIPSLPPANENPQEPVIPQEPSEVPQEPSESDLLTIPDNVKENIEREKVEIDQELLNMLEERQKQYKIAALTAKKGGDASTAIKYVKIAKQFDFVIEAVKNGQPVDLSKMPGPPGEDEPQLTQNETQKASIPEIPVPEEAANLPEPTLITASSILEALEQRLTVYQEHEAKAKEEGNSSKARRYGRIIKQFQDAIKMHKAGKSVAYDELPTPPGYGPIPIEGVGGSQPKPAEPAIPTPVTPKPAPEPTVEDDKKPSPGNRKSGNHMSTTHADKQVLILLAKQKQFKQAALNAKKKGELNEAKEFLKQAKGFDKLLEAARAGLPVDWSSIPVSPEGKSQLDNEYDIVMAEDCSEEATSDMDVLSRLENQLQKQLKMCLTTRDHNKALGDVAGANRFERLGLNVAKDLDLVRMSKKNRTIPKFRYEMKEFSIVKCFTEVPDNVMEVTVHRGINYQTDNPKDIDTYVKLEFPFPQDIPFSDKTSTIKDTNNPNYGKTFVIPIQRNSRQCQRVFKRHGIKFEVYSKGGLFRGDTLIGTVNLKLQPLETQCEIHDSFDLMEGRKKVGGKLEVQIKLRTPIAMQQVEQVQEKWLILNQ